jgi:hypothetical protein
MKEAEPHKIFEIDTCIAYAKSEIDDIGYIISDFQTLKVLNITPLEHEQDSLLHFGLM